MSLPSLRCTFRGVPGMSSPFCFHWIVTRQKCGIYKKYSITPST